MFVRTHSLKGGIYFIDHSLRNLNSFAVYLPYWWTMDDLEEEGNGSVIYSCRMMGSRKCLLMELRNLTSFQSLNK